MKLPKIIGKLPNFLSAKNQTRTYKIKIKGTEGIIVFTEMAKKEFVTTAFIRAGGMLNAKVNKAMMPNKWSVKEKKYLNIISGQMKPYINEVEKNVKKKHDSFMIYKHELEMLEFELVGENYKVTSTVKILVVV